MRLLHGPEYAHSPQKYRVDRFLAMLLSPVDTAVHAATAYKLKRHDIDASLIFQQERVGVDGMIFLINKYRTLYPGTETSVSKLTTLFRRTGLDETAQRRNIIAGEMSCVGHRPLSPLEHEAIFDNVSPKLGQRYRTIVLPTRPGQVSTYGLHSHLGFTEGADSPEVRMELDIQDVMDGSVVYDVSLCLRTIEHAVTNKLTHGHIRHA